LRPRAVAARALARFAAAPGEMNAFGCQREASYLPQYSPDLNPIGMPFSQLRGLCASGRTHNACADEAAGSLRHNRPPSAQLFLSECERHAATARSSSGLIQPFDLAA